MLPAILSEIRKLQGAINGRSIGGAVIINSVAFCGIFSDMKGAVIVVKIRGAVITKYLLLSFLET